MSFGLEAYNEIGTTIYSTEDVTWNQVDFFQLAGGYSFERHYPELVGRQNLIIQTFVNPPPTNRKAVAYSSTVNSGTLTLLGGSETVSILVLMR